MLLLALITPIACFAIDKKRNEIHVSAVSGDDLHSGSQVHPLRTIQAAANVARPGDIITVHGGVYREWVNPMQGGERGKSISFQAAVGERVDIKGSEIIKGWQPMGRGIWSVEISNELFGEFNPYADTLRGDWLERGKWAHTGEIYLNDKPLTETPRLENVLLNKTKKSLWFCKVTGDSTYLWANFDCPNPNEELVEINVRKAVFYPKKPFVDYIVVRGFRMSHAATPWAPPTAEQVGLIGTHWSRGWVIENNVVSHSKCVGITLGKYGDEWDNKSESVEGYIQTTRRALDNGWNKEHIGSHVVQNNLVSSCGQAGIAGSLGAVFSRIENNVIHDIGLQETFWGYEIAGIKLHAAVDVMIRRNHIYRTEGGIWLDWMAQGTRITRNLLHDNKLQDLSLEVNHGPVLIDNNLFLSPELAQIRLSQGVAFVNNFIAWKIWPTGKIDERETPYLQPHATSIAGYHDCPCGNVSYYSNIFTRVDLTPYQECGLPVYMEGNLLDFDANPQIVEQKGGWYLQVNIPGNWIKEKSRKIPTSTHLGRAVIPNQTFNEMGGEEVRMNVDYSGKKSPIGKKAYPGTIDFKSGELQTIKIFCKDEEVVSGN